VTTYDIAVIGGTGPQGKGLAYRWARHGHRVVLGSRSAERAEQAAAEITARLDGSSVSGATNADAAAGADVVVLAVPYDGHDDLVAALADRLAGKVVISCVNPLGFDKQGPYGLDVPGGHLENPGQGGGHLLGVFDVFRRGVEVEGGPILDQDLAIPIQDETARRLHDPQPEAVVGRQGEVAIAFQDLEIPETEEQHQTADADAEQGFAQAHGQGLDRGQMPERSSHVMWLASAPRAPGALAATGTQPRQCTAPRAT